MADVVPVFGLRAEGSTVHELIASPICTDLSRCGVKPQFRHRRATSDERPVTCATCLRLAAKKARRAWLS